MTDVFKFSASLAEICFINKSFLSLQHKQECNSMINNKNDNIPHPKVLGISK